MDKSTSSIFIFLRIEWETCQWVTISIHRNYLCSSGACWLFGVGSSAVDNDRAFTKQLMKASISFVNNLHELLLVGVLCFAKIKCAADWLVKQVKWNEISMFGLCCTFQISDIAFYVLRRVGCFYYLWQFCLMGMSLIWLFLFNDVQCHSLDCYNQQLYSI